MMKSSIVTSGLLDYPSSLPYQNGYLKSSVKYTLMYIIEEISYSERLYMIWWENEL